MSSTTSKDRQIFISIASYRDAYLPFTIESAIANAVHPERLVFGICWQADERENLDRFIDDPRFRIRRYPHTASLGYGWSRAEVQKLYDGERYHLLVDSHTAFAPGWDQNLIAQLEPDSPPTEAELANASLIFHGGTNGTCNNVGPTAAPKGTTPSIMPP